MNISDHSDYGTDKPLWTIREACFHYFGIATKSSGGSATDEFRGLLDRTGKHKQALRLFSLAKSAACNFLLPKGVPLDDPLIFNTPANPKAGVLPVVKIGQEYVVAQTHFVEWCASLRMSIPKAWESFLPAKPQEAEPETPSVAEPAALPPDEPAEPEAADLPEPESKPTNASSVLRFPGNVETWSDITLVFRDEEIADIIVNKNSIRVSPLEMGMAHKNTKKPLQMWTILKLFAMGHGTVEKCPQGHTLDHAGYQKHVAADTFKRQVQLASKHLQEYFEISKPAIVPIKGFAGWQTRFHVRRVGNM